MALCEMCGKSATLVNADVEGVELNVCPVCSKYGKIKKSSTPYQQKYTSRQSDDKPEWKVVDSFHSIMSQERRKREMNHKEFAAFLNEKESVVAKWESGGLKPRVDIARRIGKVLKLKLTEKIEEHEEKVEAKKTKSEGFTLGDFIKKR